MEFSTVIHRVYRYFINSMGILFILTIYRERVHGAITSRVQRDDVQLPKNCVPVSIQEGSSKILMENGGNVTVLNLQDVEFSLDLHQTACLEASLGKGHSNTYNMSAVVYVIRYEEYVRDYSISDSYVFAYPELKSHCLCNCPKAEKFCDSGFESTGVKCSSANVGVMCANKYQTGSSLGCEISDGPAELCCSVGIRPWDSRRYRAVSLKTALTEIGISVEIYAKSGDRLSAFRRYDSRLLPQKGNRIHLNGDENTLNLNIFVSTHQPTNNLAKEMFFYELGKTPIELLTNVPLNSLHEAESSKLGYFRYDDGWTFSDGKDPKSYLPSIHNPKITDCKNQKYEDHYKDVNMMLVKIVNSTGHGHDPVNLGTPVIKSRSYLKSVKIRRGTSDDTFNVITSHNSLNAPTISLKLTSSQKLDLSVRTHASRMAGFDAHIVLDKYRNRLINVTLIDARGAFLMEIHKHEYPGRPSEIDIQYKINTWLPVTANHTEQFALPARIEEGRYVCIKPQLDPGNDGKKLCKVAMFDAEPVEWFKLEKPFVETEGNCPGCNVEKGSTFWENLNPKNWLNGIGSWSEGIALILEIAVYIVIAVVAIALCRKVICPLLRWALCGGSAPESHICGTVRYRHKHYEKCTKADDCQSL